MADYQSAREIALAALAGDLGPEEQIAAAQEAPMSDYQAEQLFQPPRLSPSLQAYITQGLEGGGGDGGGFSLGGMAGDVLGKIAAPFEWEAEHIGRPITRTLLSPLPEGKYKDVLQMVGENVIVPTTFLPFLGFPGLVMKPGAVGARLGLEMAAKAGSRPAALKLAEMSIAKAAKVAATKEVAAKETVEAIKWLRGAEGKPLKVTKAEEIAIAKGTARRAKAKVRTAQLHEAAETQQLILEERLAKSEAYLKGLTNKPRYDLQKKIAREMPAQFGGAIPMGLEPAPVARVLTKGRQRGLWSAWNKKEKLEVAFNKAKAASREWVHAPEHVRLNESLKQLEWAAKSGGRWDTIIATLPEPVQKFAAALESGPRYAIAPLKAITEAARSPIKLGWALKSPAPTKRIARFILGHDIYVADKAALQGIYAAGDGYVHAGEVVRMRAKNWMTAMEGLWDGAGLNNVPVTAYKGPQQLAKRIGDELGEYIYEHPEWFDLTLEQRNVLEVISMSANENLAYIERALGVDTKMLNEALAKQSVGEGGTAMAVHMGKTYGGGRYLPLYLDPGQFAEQGFKVVPGAPSRKVGAKARFLKERKYADRADAAVHAPNLRFMSRKQAWEARWEASARAISDSTYKEGILRQVENTTKPTTMMGSSSSAIPGYYFAGDEAKAVTQMASLVSGDIPLPAVRKGVNIIRSMKLSLDASGALGIQGFFFLSTMLTNPGLAMRGMYSAAKFAFSPRAWDEYLMLNEDKILKMQGWGLNIVTNPVDIQRITKGELFPRIYRVPGALMDLVNDANFGRAVASYKITAAEQWLDIMKFSRDVPGFTKIAKTSPNISNMLDKIKGVEGRTMDDVAKAVMHEINNRFGGLSIAMSGKSGDRAFLEQLVDISPSWFRARTSLVMDAIKGEGPARYVAMNMMGREVALAGALSASMSYLFTGESPEIDPRSGKFLAIQIPGGASIPTIPSVSLLRLITREAASIAQTIPGTPISDPGAGATGAAQSLQRFVSGRQSPFVSAVVEQATGKDFFGRSIGDNEQRIMAAIKSLLPIFAEDIWEAIEENNPPLTVLQRGAVGIAGSSVYPAKPYDMYLDSLRSWANKRGLVLPQDKPDAPAGRQVTQIHEKEFQQGEGKELWETFLADRGRWGKDAQDHLFGVMDEYAKTWEQGAEGTLGASNMARAIKRGEIPAFRFRELVDDYWTAHEALFDTTQRALGIDDEELQKDPKRTSKLDRIANEYFQIQLDDFDLDGDMEYEDHEYLLYKQARDSLLAKYQAQVPDVNLEEFVRSRRVVRFNDPDVKDMMNQYLDAKDLQDAFYEIPRWKGLTTEQGATVDGLRPLGSKAADKLRRAAMDAGNPELASKIMESHGWQYIMQKIPAEIPKEDRTLLAFAMLLETNRKAWDYFSNDERLYFLAHNTDLLRWYPTLINLFSDEARALLPPDIEYNLDEWLADYEEAYGGRGGTSVPAPTQAPTQGQGGLETIVPGRVE